LKPSRIVRFIAIWLIIALSLFTFLPNVEKHWKGVGICITIGFLVSLFIRLLQYRKITERNIREAPGFNSLGPVEKGNFFLKS
jgi:Na+-driven multidrug efflux pump